MTTSQVHHLVIGGGPAGSMVALQLAAAGRQVTLIEKEREAHHKVCGEFLSQEALSYLNQVGISPRDLGAVDLRSVRLSSGKRLIEAALPFPALSLSRRALDAALLARAEQSGCHIQRGVAVTSLVPNAGQWVATLSNGETLRASSAFLATGKHDLHGWNRPPGKQSDLVGFKMFWRLAPAQCAALRDCMDLYLFPHGYGGLSLVEDETANLCLVVRQTSLRALGGWAGLFSSILDSNRHLRQMLNGSKPLWKQPLAISSIPYGYLAKPERGIWRVGDQVAVVPSFTGDGISIALHSGTLAANMFLSGKGVAEFNRTIRADLNRSMALATWLSRAMVTGIGRAFALASLSLFPDTMRWIAAATRIPERNLTTRESPRVEDVDPARQSA